jgi:predicted Zn-dependent protease
LSTGKTKGIDNPDAAKNISEVLKIADLDERITQLKSMYDKASSAVFNELTNHHEEIGFYLVISYLENNDRSEAKELLEQLLEQYSDNALFNQMLNDIDNIKGLF